MSRIALSKNLLVFNFLNGKSISFYKDSESKKKKNNSLPFLRTTF